MGFLRVAAIFFIAGALGAWVHAVYRLAGQPLEPYEAGPGGQTAAAPGQGLGGQPGTEGDLAGPGDVTERPFTFASNADCEPCHREIYAEWFEDQHAMAWFNSPLLPKDPKRVECSNCHAPKPVLETGVEEIPVVRADRHEEGVGCIECHKSGDSVKGPRPSARAPCNPRYEPLFTDSVICSSCHAPHGAYAEWRDSAWGKKGYSCQACHMPFVDAPAVTGGPVVRRRSHRMRSQRQQEVLREAVTMEARLLDGGRVEISLTNKGAGHNVPGEISNRELFLHTILRDREGRDLAERRESFKTVRRDQRSSLPSTQLKPGETRVFTYDLGTDHGRVETRLGYKLFFFIPDDRAMPVWEKQIDF